MVFTPSGTPVDMDIRIGDEKIEIVQDFRYLGVQLDSKLSYKNHVEYITTKCRQAIGALCRTVRKWASLSTFKTLYTTTIEPMLTYAIESWYPSEHGLQDKLERVKKFAAKLSTNDFTSPYTTLLRKLGWKPVCQIAMKR